MITLIDGAPTRLELPDNDWVEVKDMPFDAFIGLVGGDVTNENEMAKRAPEILPFALVGWSLKDANNDPIPCTVENIKKLGTRGIMTILPVVQAFYMPSSEKKTTSTT